MCKHCVLFSVCYGHCQTLMHAGWLVWSGQVKVWKRTPVTDLGQVNRKNGAADTHTSHLHVTCLQ